MNDLAGRTLRRMSGRGGLFLGRSNSRLDSWLYLLRRPPARYTLHAVAVLVWASALVWSTSGLWGDGELRAVDSLDGAAQVASAAEAAVELSSVPAPEAAPTPASAAPEPFYYRVQPGDTLRSIAERFDVSVHTLVWGNRLENPDLLRPDQELLILPTSGVLHIVQPGETLRHVADRYGVSVDDLAGYNGIEDPDRIAEGVRLVVPGGSPMLGDTARAGPNGEAVAGAPTLTALADLAPLPPSANPDTRALAAPKPTPTPKPSSVEYEVQPGDTLNFLTQIFGVDLDTILEVNDIDDPDLIKPGMKLRVLPVSGLEHEIDEGETLADIAAHYQVDLGPILDFNDLPNPDLIHIGMKLIVPGAKRPDPPPPPAAAPAPPAPDVAPAPVAPAPAPPPAPPPPVTGRGAAIVQNAMPYQGYPYVWGGTGPRGFDCSGFVYYVYQISGHPIPRGMWGQLNAGPRIERAHLSPGDIVFFANTYQPGLSHNGIYIGGGQFIHASTPGTGVVVTSMSSPYWASRYVGATRP